MSKFFYLTFFFTTLVISQVTNYHERKIYLSEYDNVCNPDIPGNDKLNLEVEFSDGRETLKKTMSGRTECREFALYDWNAIVPKQSACWEEVNPSGNFDQIFFDQETEYKWIGGFILVIIQKLTVRGEGVFGNEKYVCTVVGNGKIEHWGPEKNNPAPTVKVLCSKQSQQLNLQTK